MSLVTMPKVDTAMKCEECGQRSDWIGEDSQWQPINDAPVMLKMYECVDCGHRQRIA